MRKAFTAFMAALMAMVMCGCSATREQLERYADSHYGKNAEIEYKCVVTLAPDVEAEARITAEQMRACARVLDKRLDRMGYSDARAEVNEDNTLTVSVPEIPAADEAEEDMEILERMGELRLLDSDGNPIMGGECVRDAEAMNSTVSGSPRHSVCIYLTDEGRRSLSEAAENALSKQADGKNYISIVLDGEILLSPMVYGAIDADSFVISNEGFTEDSAKACAALIGGGALPFKLKTSEVIVSEPNAP